MHHYAQYCPVARAAEVLADRWTVLIARELLADINHFNEVLTGEPITVVAASRSSQHIRLSVVKNVMQRQP